MKPTTSGSMKIPNILGVSTYSKCKNFLSSILPYQRLLSIYSTFTEYIVEVMISMALIINELTFHLKYWRL